MRDADAAREDGVRLGDAELIRKHIEMDPHRPGPAEALLRDSGVHVWAIVGQWQAAGRDASYVAESYELPLEAVLAALAYYRQNMAVIEARLAANVA